MPDPATQTPATGRRPRTVRQVLPWLFGAALLTAVVGVALRSSEAGDFVRLTEQARPWWLALALLLQIGTYVAQGEIWRRVGAAAGTAIPPGVAFSLSLAKLSADQMIPSAGISGSVVVARALEQRTMPAGAVKATVLLNLATYHVAYVVTLALALGILEWDGHATLLVVMGSVLFSLFAAALTAGILLFSGRTHASMPHPLTRYAPVRSTLLFVEQADARLVRSPRLLLQTTALQILIVLLDAATLWTLLRSIGADGSVTGVFASFMIASLVRTIGIVPGGLGTFEATSVLALTLTGTAIPAALAATLLFRGLSFWIPMLPGLWLSRRALAPSPAPGAETLRGPYWADAADTVAQRLRSGPAGLTGADARERLERLGPNTLREQRALSRPGVLLNQLRSPLLLLLVFAAAASGLTREWVDAGIVLTIVFATVAIGYSREYSAQTAAAALKARVHLRTTAVRDGRPGMVPAAEIVPGDAILLTAGSLVPADALILDATDFYVSEAALTGESFPVSKAAGLVDRAASLAERTNCVFLGTNVRSGVARCLVVRTGAATEFGAIADRLLTRPPDTEFDRGIRQFGYLLTSAMLILVLLVFTAHVLAGRPAIETLLFAIALAVGLSPELLPAILSVNLARGAQMMAAQGVLVRRLNAIENLGSMDILCTDKTGTLTEGVIRMEGAYDTSGAPSAEVLELAALNAALDTGLANPLDEAVTAAHAPDLANLEKLAEIPFDFARKRASVVTKDAGGVRLITKGAFHHVLEACTRVGAGAPLDARLTRELDARHEAWSSQGIRVLAVASRAIEEKATYSRDDEREMTLAGFVTFLDQPHDGVQDALTALAHLGVSVKLITGDNGLVARHVAALVGMRTAGVLTGHELDDLPDEALWRVAERTDLFVEVDPRQKERIILALKAAGHVVGFLGDGVNDAPAMHAADTSLSVEHAVDVAREAADFVLLEQGLDVIRRGVVEGRKTFANTLKYVQITTSANLGNMVSMAAASLYLPFLPLLAGQILLNNFLSDIPAVGLANDNVDTELVERPERWHIAAIGRFMVVFGAVSSAFDFLMFGVLRSVFHASPEVFRTAWFVESLLTELVVVFVVRTRRPVLRSQPGRVLLVSTLALIAVAYAIPFVPYTDLFGFVPLPAPLVLVISLVALLYVGAAELTKRRFYMHAAPAAGGTGTD